MWIQREIAKPKKLFFNEKRRKMDKFKRKIQTNIYISEPVKVPKNEFRDASQKDYKKA